MNESVASVCVFMLRMLGQELDVAGIVVLVAAGGGAAAGAPYAPAGQSSDGAGERAA